MSSVVYFKFKANVRTDSIPFDGSSISVKDLKSAIRTKCCMYSTDFELKLEDTNGKAYVKDDELIPKYTSIVVRRVPKPANDGPRKKANAADDTPWREMQKAVNSTDSQQSKHMNLADSDLSEEEKIKIMMERSSEAYSEKNYTVKAKPYGIPPPAYICHKCSLPGHWIHNCPGIRDKTGKMMDVKSVKRPTGIPQDFLLEVEAGTPGAYLGKSGKYMVPIKDAEAYAQGKKDKRPFSIEENPPYVPTERTPPKQFICPLCNQMFRDAVLVSCCGSTYCNECIMGHVFDAQILGSHKCPSCGAVLTDHESSVFENALVRSMIRDWLSDEIQPPDPDVTVNHGSIFKLDDEKTFVNNRRVLKPKQSLASVNTSQSKCSTDNIPTKAESESNIALEDTGSVKNEKLDACIMDSAVSTDNKAISVAASNASPNSISLSDLAFANIPPVVTSNTSSTVVASQHCATLLGASNQSLLASTGLQNVPFPCLSYTNSTAVVPNLLPNLNGANNALLNAIYNMRVENLPTQLVGSQSVLAAPFQGPLVCGPEWTADSVLSGSVSQNTGIVDPVLQFTSNQTAYGLVHGQAVPGTIPTTLSAPIRALDGHKVLSKEEFYRLKMEMLHSARRR